MPRTDPWTVDILRFQAAVAPYRHDFIQVGIRMTGLPILSFEYAFPRLPCVLPRPPQTTNVVNIVELMRFRKGAHCLPSVDCADAGLLSCWASSDLTAGKVATFCSMGTSHPINQSSLTCRKAARKWAISARHGFAAHITDSYDFLPSLLILNFSAACTKSICLTLRNAIATFNRFGERFPPC